ncbi:MAG: hypothetical protein PQ612_05420 [Rickettsiales bacterium]|nr:hypothetical protein [Pseudomonadota bacterium]MDA0966459.1 hypothetical protein [Pseudomonadota bacterium]MDG4543321.1 hypothetical protein [Rickettsiales bacterium]MDG4545587.1 hypothetical protein [Rickettsiales bacterium]MDG4548036.1 hypothetical protein [Rickettsiales bacterium]
MPEDDKKTKKNKVEFDNKVKAKAYFRENEDIESPTPAGTIIGDGDANLSLINTPSEKSKKERNSSRFEGLLNSVGGLPIDAEPYPKSSTTKKDIDGNPIKADIKKASSDSSLHRPDDNNSPKRSSSDSSFKNPGGRWDDQVQDMTQNHIKAVVDKLNVGEKTKKGLSKIVRREIDKKDAFIIKADDEGDTARLKTLDAFDSVIKRVVKDSESRDYLLENIREQRHDLSMAVDEVHDRMSSNEERGRDKKNATISAPKRSTSPEKTIYGPATKALADRDTANRGKGNEGMGSPS